MTYRPVPDATTGRKPVPIPDALLSQLQHSERTGARCVIELTGDEPAEEIADLKRALIRAGYRHFPTKTIHKRFRVRRIEFWVGEKVGKK